MSAADLSLPLSDLAGAISAGAATAIDREELVSRHSPTILQLDPFSPLTVGNGGFAFTADITGLQTFPEAYKNGIPLNTQAQWGWHSLPDASAHKPADAMEPHQVGGRQGRFPAREDSPGGAGIRANPHPSDLGRIGLHIRRPGDGRPAQPSDIANIRQTLNLWTGGLDSRFTVEGAPVRIQTHCLPAADGIAVKIESPMLAAGSLGVVFAFSGSSDNRKMTAKCPDPVKNHTDAHIGGSRCDFIRTLDDSKYHARVEWSSGGMLRPAGSDCYELVAPGENQLAFVAAFSDAPFSSGAALPDFAAAKEAGSGYWKRFWTDGAVVDFTGSADPRANELERRIVLSQYLTAINCAGSVPPQETGLTSNSWFGAFHLESHWWHAAQFALWNRPELLEKSLAWYQSVLPGARANARRQGCRGARWPEMAAPDGQDTQGKAAPSHIWQEPHPIYLAELIYRAHPDSLTVSKYEQIVGETASFMASYAARDENADRFVLGPGMLPAQESYGNESINPTFELAYWWWALETAQQWRLRQGMKRDVRWDEVLEKLAKPTVKDGVYAAIENPPRTMASDHPSMLGAFGMIPATPMVDRNTMDRTLDRVLKTWDWPTTWGSDYPLVAMAAARLGRPDDAVNALVMDVQQNTYLPNGHNYQNERQPVYLPGNGGLLAAVAMMAGGWDGAPAKDAPGFPKNGKWRIRSEGLKPMP